MLTGNCSCVISEMGLNRFGCLAKGIGGHYTIPPSYPPVNPLEYKGYQQIGDRGIGLFKNNPKTAYKLRVKQYHIPHIPHIPYLIYLIMKLIGYRGEIGDIVRG